MVYHLITAQNIDRPFEFFVHFRRRLVGAGSGTQRNVGGLKSSFIKSSKNRM